MYFKAIAHEKIFTPDDIVSRQNWPIVIKRDETFANCLIAISRFARSRYHVQKFSRSRGPLHFTVSNIGR